ncbi:MAG: hypothetical protein L6R42_006276 [Xanthoria sp. 1 TBL-2021]|nr:MAG: hypothetical protein L6R42_006276 [Xanthoria sp. 1 TBL-2021]
MSSIYPAPFNPLSLEIHMLNVLLTTLPDANRSAEDNEIFTLRNALCCLRHKYWKKFNDLRRSDLENAIEALKEYNPSYITFWNAAGPTSPEKENAYRFFREVYAKVREDLADRMKHLEVVTTDENLSDHDGFPQDSLDYLCTGIKMDMPKADLAKALEKMYPTAAHANKLGPFTEANVDRIFEYLRIAGWSMYDEFVLSKGEPYDEKREDKMAELWEEAGAA